MGQPVTHPVAVLVPYAWKSDIRDVLRTVSLTFRILAFYLRTPRYNIKKFDQSRGLVVRVSDY
jgi:hypothetical protein